MLMARSTLSVFSEVYGFIAENRGKESLRIPEGVRRELAAACLVAPLMRADLSAGWSSRVYMTDASPTGGAAVVCNSSRSEIVE